MKRRTQRSVFTKISPELVKELVGLLIKILIESVKDKLVRAVLIGVISSAGSLIYVSNEDIKTQTPGEVSVPMETKSPL